jgi:ABC-2 type transport system ATP-binding protein
MQQRLSLARVLLHDPKVLLLDEPASGLDPRARIEIRELLKELHRMGKTILISSHILLELADFCTKIGIIERGQMVFVGSVPEIIERTRVGQILNVAVANRIPDAIALIKQIPGVLGVETADGQMQVNLEPGKVDPALIAEKLITAGFRLTRLEEEKANLETAFMRLTKGLVQ